MWNQGAWHALLAENYIPRVNFEGLDAGGTFRRGSRVSSGSRAGKHVELVTCRTGSCMHGCPGIVPQEGMAYYVEGFILCRGLDSGRTDS